MDHRDHECFVHLATSLHFGRSARALGMSTSALTRRLQALEEELGHALLLRDSRTTSLTRAGEVFLAFSRAELERYAELQGDLARESESPSGELVVACTVTACHTVLPELLADFRRNYPKVELRLITQDAARSVQQLENGEVDLAVIPTDPASPPAFDAKVLGRTTFAWIAPGESADTDRWLERQPLDLERVPLISALGGLERARLFDFLGERRLTPRIVAEVRGNEGIIALVALGMGVALVPRLVLDASPLGHRVREIPSLEAPPGYDVSLCVRTRSLSRRVVAALWSHAGQSA